MHKTIIVTAVAVAALVVPAGSASSMPLVRLAQAASKHPAAPTVPATSDYLRASLMGDMFEVQAAQVAQNKSQNPYIQNFAQLMARDHGAIRDELASILKQSSFDFSPPSDLDNEHAAMVDQLKDLANGSFDRSYIQQQIEAHEAALRLQNNYAKAGRDQQLRKFAAEIVPKIRAHLELAKQVFSRITRVASRSR